MRQKLNANIIYRSIKQLSKPNKENEEKYITIIYDNVRYVIYFKVLLINKKLQWYICDYVTLAVENEDLDKI